MASSNTTSVNQPAQHVAARIGHAHIHVRELEPSIAFYEGILGLKTTEKVADRFAFLSAGEHHHDLALQAIGKHAPDAPRGVPGLYHVAFQVDDAAELLVIWDRLAAFDVRISTVDHGISWAIYFQDLDGNGVEVYLDRRDELEGTDQWHGQSKVISYEQVKQASLAG